MTVLHSPNDIKLIKFKEYNKSMKNREIIQFIDRYCAHKEDLDVNSNADLAYTILAHGYLYVKPGKPTEKFTLRVIEALKVGATDGFNNYLEDEYCSWSLDEWIRISMANTALQVAREEFDKKYFKKQIKLLELDEECDDALLDKYLNLMNKDQLATFMDEVSYYRAHYLTFTCIDVETEITDELHERCRKVNPLLPEKAHGLEYLSFREKNPNYLLDYLSKEEIVSAIKREIIWNNSLAGHVARMLYNTNSVGVMESYIELISTYEYTFHKDIYKPHIFYETLYLI